MKANVKKGISYAVSSVVFGVAAVLSFKFEVMPTQFEVAIGLISTIGSFFLMSFSLPSETE